MSFLPDVPPGQLVAPVKRMRVPFQWGRDRSKAQYAVNNYTRMKNHTTTTSKQGADPH